MDLEALQPDAPESLLAFAEDASDDIGELQDDQEELEEEQVQLVEIQIQTEEELDRLEDRIETWTTIAGAFMACVCGGLARHLFQTIRQEYPKKPAEGTSVSVRSNEYCTDCMHMSSASSWCIRRVIR